VLYVFEGATPRDVLERYTELTGRIALPPIWALGNQQSKWGYMSAEELRAIAAEFRAREIPCDVLYLDIDYMDGFRVFTFDPERYPDPAAFLSALADDGFRVVTIIDPGVKVDDAYPVYVEGHDRGYYCRTFTDEEYQNVVWSGRGCARSRTSRTRRRASGGARITRRCSTSAWPGSGAT
jgi:alpha-glucosidase